MKYFKAFICIFLISFLLSGCNFRISSSIDDLISPLSPFGDNADVKEALDRYVSNGYTLKTPDNGRYISSYNFYDFDSDGTEEAFVFYEPSDNLGSICLAVITKNDSKWDVACSVTGAGKDVYSLDFVKLNNDALPQVIVCWDAISNSMNHELVVYTLNLKSAKPTLKAFDETKNVSEYYCADMYGDKNNELLLLNTNTGSSKSPRAELYSLNSGSFELLGETKLDSRIATFSSINEDTVDGKTQVYVDAITSDGALMITELLVWDEDYESIVSPFYSYSSMRTEETSREARLVCMDIDGDGLLEIPIDYSLRSLPDKVFAVKFTDYRHTVLVHNSYALFVENDKYVFVLPNEVLPYLSVKYSSKDREMSIENRQSKKVILKIKPVLKATYKENEHKKYQIVSEASGYYYLAQKGDDSEVSFTDDEIKQNLKPINQNGDGE